MLRPPRRTAEFFALMVAVSATFASPRALAQGAGEGAGEVVAPALVEPAEAAYPEQARAARLEGTVVLRLTIDAEGRVAEAEVLEPAGNGFDEAAREAALRFRFNPARRGGRPVPSRIRYAYAFKLSIEPEAPKAPPPVQSAAPAAGPPATAGEGARPAAGGEGGGAGPATSEVTVRGAPNEAQRLQQSAEAVNVIDTRRAQKQTADMGEVLARTQGVSVRRNGGLGSNARFSLNGLYDDQVRFFLDGAPLDLAGYPFGVANVPVNLVERVEVYRGVVPVRFGADALGGAVNLVTDQKYRTRLSASDQVGSFGTHRVTVDGRYRHDTTGLVAGGSGFFDVAKNNYRVDVELADERGRPSPATVPRFHDGYRAYGVALEAGVVDRPWARRLTLQAFASSYDKDLQHNVIMTVPYGEAAYGETVYGATARYDAALQKNVDLEVVANYARRTIDYVDKARWVYDWLGRRVRERSVAGEIEPRPSDQTQWQNGAFGRATLKWAITGGHALRLSVSPSLATRTGDERLQADPNGPDPLSAKNRLFTVVSGLEYELNAFEGRLSNVAFIKDYAYRADTEEPLPGGTFRDRELVSHTRGAGDALRFRFTPWLYAKASYEYATRLPRPDEVFGNGVLIHANLDLKPEVSHNANLGPRVELRKTPLGDLTVDVNAFLRDSDKLIFLQGADRFFSYQNVRKARSAGVEGALSWSSPGRTAGLDGMLTWLDARNASSDGPFAAYEGERLPNRPYLFASWGARLRLPNLPGPADAVEPFYNGRYVHAFFLGWESQGARETKQTVNAQVTHDVGVSWTVDRDPARVTSTLEIDNVTDAKVFDNFGVQRPGRAVFLKLTGTIE